jgi:hypothetical protein
LSAKVYNMENIKTHRLTSNVSKFRCDVSWLTQLEQRQLSLLMPARSVSDDINGDCTAHTVARSLVYYVSKCNLYRKCMSFTHNSALRAASDEAIFTDRSVADTVTLAALLNARDDCCRAGMRRCEKETV